MGLQLKVKTASNYLEAGEHDVKILSITEKAYKHGELAQAITFQSLADGKIIEQFYPTKAFKTWEQEEDGAKCPDALTDAELASGMYRQEMNDKGELMPYAEQFKEMVKGKLVDMKRPVRVHSDVKSDAALAIIERLAGACGFDVDTDIDIDDLKDSECTITVKKVENTLNGKEYFRVTKAVPLFVQA